MASAMKVRILSALLFCLFNVIGAEIVTMGNKNHSFCSFFNNRAPKAQPGLKNCTWFKDNSCCQEQEIKATFGRMKPLKGASVECQKYINYLMCYICAPNQNLFYRQERLTVCVEFCDKLYDACQSAILKGSIIGNLYDDGTEFCLSRRFQVEEGTDTCFRFDEKLDTSSRSDVHGSGSHLLLVATVVLSVLFQLPASEARMFIPKDMQGRSRKKKYRDEVTDTLDQTKPSTGVYNMEYVENERITKNSGLEMSLWPLPSMKTSEQLHHEASKQWCTSNYRPVANATSPGSNMPLYNRYVTVPLLLEKSLIALLLFILHIHCGHAELTKDNIKMWAELISADLTDVARKGLRYEEIQRLYDKAQYATEYINGTSKVLEVREKLGM